jgi:hypothetical protein
MRRPARAGDHSAMSRPSAYGAVAVLAVIMLVLVLVRM